MDHATTPADAPRKIRDREGPHYPQTETHTWGAFAGLALEFDGYNNCEVIQPWTGEVLFVPGAANTQDEPNPMAATLRRVADAIEQVGWVM